MTTQLEDTLLEFETLDLAIPHLPDFEGDEIFASGLDETDPWEGLRQVNKKFKAVISSSNLISFVDGLDALEKRDILESTQFAERAANARFSRNNQIQEWYEYFAEVLSKTGWVSEGLSFKQTDSDTGNFDMSKHVLGVIAAVATGNQLAILNSAIDALSNMADSEQQIRWFDFSTTVDVGGNFQLGAAESAGDGIVSMALGAFYYRSSDRRKNALFFKWGRNEIDMWVGAQKMTLDTSFYAQFRELIRGRLGTTTTDFLARVPIT